MGCSIGTSRKFKTLVRQIAAAACGAALFAGAVLAQEPAAKKGDAKGGAAKATAPKANATKPAAKTKDAPAKDAPTKETPATPEGKSKPDAKGADAKLVRLSKTHDIWLDTERKQLIIEGYVCLREGFLEMFACPKGTKEHESIVAVHSDAMTVHAGLLALNAQSGSPVKFDPKFVPASGAKIDIFVTWTDADGKAQKVRAQEWIREVQTKKELSYPWVFAGSGFFVDEDSGKRYYHADAGDLICVSNFPTATLDLPIESSQANANLQFEAFSERIPPKGTKIRLILQPRPDESKAKTDSPLKDSAKPAEPAKQ